MQQVQNCCIAIDEIGPRTHFAQLTLIPVRLYIYICINWNCNRIEINLIATTKIKHIGNARAVGLAKQLSLFGIGKAAKQMQ